MLKRIPLHLPAALGLSILIGGFIYDVLFAGIPYQDPTPEMSARYSSAEHIAFTLMTTGGVILIGGFIFYGFRWYQNRTEKQKSIGV